MFLHNPSLIVATPYVLSANWAGKYHMGLVPDSLVPDTYAVLQAHERHLGVCQPEAHKHVVACHDVF
jgi:hypothetical protein